jgi:CheY-like chemotaxis protein
VVVWNDATGSHTAQFYESERFLHRAIERFLAPAMTQGAPAVMIARPRTFEIVADQLSTGTDFSRLRPFEASGSIRFVDVDEALAGFMRGDVPDAGQFELGFSNLLAEIRRDGRAEGPIRIYGEMVDVLCREGRFGAAIRLEELWNGMFGGPEVSALCGYALEAFDDDLTACHFRNVCQQHTHVIPAEQFTDPTRDKAWCEQVALLQHRTRVRNRVPAQAPVDPPRTGIGASATTIYVIDDDASVRRSLARLLALAEWQVRTFASAEAFLAEVEPPSCGCLVLDVQLAGMSGIDLQLQMAAAQWNLPIIAMSASHDARIEAEAMRLGAQAFLRKPFDPQRLLDTVARALRSQP